MRAIRLLLGLSMLIMASGCPSGIICEPRELDPVVAAAERDELRRRLLVTASASEAAPPSTGPRAISRAR